MNVLRYSFGRMFGLSLVLYGILGVFIALAIVVLGYETFGRVQSVADAIDAERLQVAASVRTVAGTVRDTASTTQSFQGNVDNARTAADSASLLAFNTSISFRQMAQEMNVQVFGVQPFATVVPQFQQSADQLEQLAITLGNTRDGLQQSSGNVRLVSTDLSQLQVQLSQMADSLDRASSFGSLGPSLVPFKVAFYGMCLLVFLQSLLGAVAGFALIRLVHVPGTRPLTIVGRGGRVLLDVVEIDVETRTVTSHETTGTADVG